MTVVHGTATGRLHHGKQAKWYFLHWRNQQSGQACLGAQMISLTVLQKSSEFIG
jgi:hypothetical protein